MMSFGTAWLVIHLLNSACVTVSALLSGIAASLVYFVSASVMTMMNFLPSCDVFSGPNRSM